MAQQQSETSFHLVGGRWFDSADNLATPLQTKFNRINYARQLSDKCCPISMHVSVLNVAPRAAHQPAAHTAGRGEAHVVT